MAVSCASLTSGSSSTDGGPFSTASVTPSAGKLYLVAVTVVATSPAPRATAVTGLGLTWELVVDAPGNGSRTVSIFAAIGTPTSGSLAFTIAAGSTPTACVWVVAEASGANLSGGVAGAIAQIAAERNTATTQSSALFPNPITAGSATFGAVGANPITTPVSPWEPVAAASATAPTSALTAMFSAVGQQDVQATVATAQALVPVGIEIKAASANLDKLRIGDKIPSQIIIAGSPDRPVSRVYDGPIQLWP